ncbi:MAG: translation initiation factor eIF-1A [Candidatus Diapherotrites archaeon]
MSVEKEKDENQIQEEIKKIPLPKKENLEMFGMVVQLHGSNQVKILCEDGLERICRIPGRMKKKTWLRERDIVIIKLWDFQPSKADVVWRYLGTHVEHLKKKGLLKNFDV